MSFSPYYIINILVAVFLTGILLRYLLQLRKGAYHKPAEWLEDIKAGKISPVIIRIERSYADKIRFYNLWFQIRRINQQGIPGAMAELGVYQGESARIIHHLAPERDFFLFDTFMGFPSSDLRSEEGKAAGYSPVHFSDTNIDRVIRYIDGNEKIHPVPGIFPGSAESFPEMNFALVNLDADLYEPTRAGLQFFYPRLSPGGVILIHDHNRKWEGIRRAVEEFSETIPEEFFQVPDRDGTVMIIKNRVI